MNNRWYIEGDYLVRNRGGLGDFDPNIIYERLVNLISEMQKRNDPLERRYLCFRKVSIEYGLKIGTVKYVYSFIKNKQVKHVSTR